MTAGQQAGRDTAGPAHGPGALVVIDMINTYDHDDAEQLVPSARPVVPVVAGLIRRARAAGAPVIYVNDNFGQWRSHHGEIVDSALAGPHAGLVEPILPDDTSLFVIKARHSIFYETPLSYLLWQLGVRHVVLCGQVTEQCVLYSALDAHIRHLQVSVPRDGVAHIHPRLADAALEMMRRNMNAEVVDADQVSFGAGARPPSPGP
ncbi:Maleamate amidohydrolase [Streptomyces sp. YIM 130001]|uniref:isochorismatase family cysteine hydrolase n=1 Tax=Streptomyces sp. YIM 130001 TaxID=2259644 RepID=UPI000E6504AA|nr:isochorismatase family cysteine hydrolase [Streptomyces sp. YIM 130001]RII14235.1 Maleamate amidohydrolase [Streptomyces sp. YIM 130001]